MSEATPFLGLGAYRWLALLAAVLVLLLLADAAIGHARTRFRRRVQWLPFAVGIPLVVAAVLVAVLPVAWTRAVLWWLGWAAVLTGVTGAVMHHVYGVRRQPGGYRLLLHHLMHGAPQLAPLGLALAGGLALVAASGAGRARVALGVSLPTLVLSLVAVGLLFAAAQAWVLHLRGAFNSAAMWVPVVLPPLAAAAALWGALAPSAAARVLAVLLLWLTFLAGVVGLGMHLRGFERRPGGLYLWRSALFDGPAAAAPATLSLLAAVGLLSVHLLGAGDAHAGEPREPRLVLPGGAPPAAGTQVVPPGSPEFAPPGESPAERPAETPAPTPPPAPRREVAPPPTPAPRPTPPPDTVAPPPDTTTAPPPPPSPTTS